RPRGGHPGHVLPRGQFAARRGEQRQRAGRRRPVRQPLTLAASPVPRRWLWGASALAMVLAFCQSPGRIVADTKLDLTANPLGFLGRAAHQWSAIAPLGQVQNQAYGYFFPHGAFFALGNLA